MGFFDRLSPRKPEVPSAAVPAMPVDAVPEKTAAAGGVLPRLTEARAKLRAKDLPGALAIYEEVLAAAADRSDVMVTISADLGTNGHVREIIELLAPRYDLEKHGAAAGINLLQAYLATRNPEAAQHLLDLLFSLQQPALESRLVGFSKAIAEIYVTEGEADHAAEHAAVAAPVEKKINLVSISKPVWFYGLEDHAPHLLPRKEGRVRRLAFAQLALPGLADAAERAARPEDDLGRLTRGFPLWLAETFASSNGFESIAALGVMGAEHYALFHIEWAAENIRQLSDSVEGGVDYVVTGAVRNRHDDFELGVRIWEVKKSRELKAFLVRWTPATADAELGKFHELLRTYLEWSPLSAGLPYAPPAAPSAYLQGLGALATDFLAEKGVLPAGQAPDGLGMLLRSAQANPDDARAQLALVAALLRRKARGNAVDPAALQQASTWLASDKAQAADASALIMKLA
ncbi:MAG: hypothetical protein PSV13_04550 [Lacunisphaera sp.]|nr:hypothetical protein [Lacunisphaera sp.]